MDIKESDFELIPEGDYKAHRETSLQEVDNAILNRNLLQLKYKLLEAPYKDRCVFTAYIVPKNIHREQEVLLHIDVTELNCFAPRNKNASQVKNKLNNIKAEVEKLLDNRELSANESRNLRMIIIHLILAINA